MNPLAERPSTEGGVTDAVPDGYGRVTVTLAGTGARTLYPAEMEFGDIILSFQGPVGASHEPVTGGSATVDLPWGPGPLLPRRIPRLSRQWRRPGAARQPLSVWGTMIRYTSPCRPIRGTARRRERCALPSALTG
ncbi:hypothetical protein, partial [Treponema primitia]|uniref:hypothetical protein n=1 Tax=Treponema primitia TaxID=88058 RepID=UPI0018E18795